MTTDSGCVVRGQAQASSHVRVSGSADEGLDVSDDCSVGLGEEVSAGIVVAEKVIQALLCAHAGASCWFLGRAVS